MSKNIKMIELVDQAVSGINNDIYDDAPKELLKFIENNGELVTYESNGNVIIINFLGFSIWNSDGDMRKYNDETDEYESLELFLGREIDKMLYMLSEFIKNKEYNEDE